LINKIPRDRRILLRKRKKIRAKLENTEIKDMLLNSNSQLPVTTYFTNYFLPFSCYIKAIF